MYKGKRWHLQAEILSLIAQRAIVTIAAIVLVALVYAVVTDNGQTGENDQLQGDKAAEDNVAEVRMECGDVAQEIEPEEEAKHCDWSVPSGYQGKIVEKRVRFYPKKQLALTFDDGPDPKVTPQILDTLKEYNAHATFFVLGSYAERHPDLLRRIVNEGHVIGNHSWSHPKTFSDEEASDELNNTAATIAKITGHQTTLFRPPYGLAASKYSKLALSEGYTGFLWTISSADSRPIAAEIIARNVAYTPNPGDIVLMHDGPGHIATAKALPIILAKLDNDGFDFVTLPELLRAWDQWEIEKGNNDR